MRSDFLALTGTDRPTEASPAFLHEKETLSQWMAYRPTMSMILENSSAGDRKARRRMGMLKNRSSTLICVPCLPAVDLGSAGAPGFCGTMWPSRYLACHATAESFVLVVTDRCAIWLMLASASPRNPYVAISLRSSKEDSLLVVCLSQRMARSSFYRQHLVGNTGVEERKRKDKTAIQ